MKKKAFALKIVRSLRFIATVRVKADSAKDARALGEGLDPTEVDWNKHGVVVSLEVLDVKELP